MKEGRSLSALCAELDRQLNTKQDVIARQDAIKMDLAAPAEPEADKPAPAPQPRIVVSAEGIAPLPIRPHAHGQLAAHLGIPKAYYDRMLGAAPALLQRNVNTWLEEAPAKRRMVRILDGQMRACMSDAYQRIENFDVAEQALRALADVGEMNIVSCEVTELRLYIKATFPKVRREVAVGDIIEAGVMIRNSEVGASSADVTPFANRLICLNGMVIPDGKFSARHVGSRQGGDEDAYILREDTKRASDQAILLKLRDYIAAAADEASFDRRIEKMRGTAERRMTGDIAEGVQVLAKARGLLEFEKASVLRHLIEGGDLSQWGLINAVTRTAADCQSYDRATDLETLGGLMLDMPASEWRQIAEAA